MNIYTSEVEMLRAECKEWEKVCDQHLRYINKLKKKIAKQDQVEHLAMQVRPSEFAELIKGKEAVTGIPAYWAEWPNKEKP